jgi:hypothetical protein
VTINQSSPNSTACRGPSALPRPEACECLSHPQRFLLTWTKVRLSTCNLAFPSALHGAGRALGTFTSGCCITIWHVPHTRSHKNTMNGSTLRLADLLLFCAGMNVISVYSGSNRIGRNHKAQKRLVEMSWMLWPTAPLCCYQNNRRWDWAALQRN